MYVITACIQAAFFLSQCFLMYLNRHQGGTAFTSCCSLFVQDINESLILASFFF